MTDTYTYDILSWNPINTDSFNLMTKVSLKVDPKLLALFKLAPFFSILCKVSGTNSSYDDKMVYGTIDMSTDDRSIYYITLDHVWSSYPDQNKKGKITFLADSVGETIQYLTEKNASPIIGLPEDTHTSTHTENAQKPAEKSKAEDSVKKFTVGNPGEKTPGTVSNQFCSNSRMKLADIFLPVGISLLLIGGLHYVLPKKLLD